MAPGRSNGLPSDLYTTRTFYTLSGASVAVWIFSGICGNFLSQDVHRELEALRILTLGAALVVGFRGTFRRGRSEQDILLAFFNGLLIYASATGINAVSQGTDLKKHDGKVSVAT